MKLLITIPLAATDLPYALSLAHSLKSTGPFPNPCLIIASHGVDPRPFVVALSGIFPSIEAIATPFALPDESYPYGSNWRFETAAKHVAQHSATSWLYLDPRCVPVKRSWLTDLELAYNRAATAFMGAVLTPQQHSTPHPLLASVAIYPPRLPKRMMQRLVAQRSVDFERSCADLVVPLATHTPLIWTQPSNGNTPICTPADVPKDAVLAHTGAARSLSRSLYGAPTDAPKPKVTTSEPVVVAEPGKRTTTPAIAAPAAPSNTTYYHSGSLGDVIYALYAIRKAGGGRLLIGPQQRRTPAPSDPIKEPKFDLLRPLLEAQPYISKAIYTPRHPGTDTAFDLNLYRSAWADTELRSRTRISTIIRMHCHILNVDEQFRPDEAWLTVPSPIRHGYICCHRTSRYHNDDFPWAMLLKRYSGRLLFVGLPAEHTELQRTFGVKVAYWQPTNLLELARIIAGAEGFIGNQSLPMAIALGCGQRVLQESWAKSPDCLFSRANFLTQPITESQLAAWERSPRLGDNRPAAKAAVVAASPAVVAPTPTPFLFSPNRRWYPSFLEQSQWPTGMFDFAQPAPANGKGVCYFNPCLERVNNDLLMFNRRFAYHWKNFPREGCIGQSVISVWKVSDDRSVTPISRISAVTKIPANQWDDPHTLQFGGKLYLSAATWDGNIHNYPCRQIIYEVAPTLDTMVEVATPEIGVNGKGCEKNWIFFVHDGDVYTIYLLDPYTIYKLDNKWNPTGKVVEQEQRAIPWHYGLPRGSTNPVRVDDLYWTFFHSSLPWRGGKRRYFMGALAFDAKPPFAPRRLTTSPLLAGSEEDPRTLSGPCVVFPGGAVYDPAKRQWLVVFGVNDENCGWMELPHDALTAATTKL